MLTLTVRNLKRIDAGELELLKKAWVSLRRSKLFEKVSGGFWSMEITNQGKGWHAHIHAVLDSQYLDQSQIERAWSKRIGQEMSIVDIRELRGPDPLKEVVKYTSKPTQMIHWSDDDLRQFLDVAPSLRMFGVFGTCYKQRSEFREFNDELKSESGFCECGCNSWKILDAVRPSLHLTPPQRPPPKPQLSLGLDLRSSQHLQALSR